MTGRLRLWPMNCRTSTKRDWQLMLPWCLLSERMGMHVASVLTTIEQLCSKRDARKRPRIQSYTAHGAAEHVLLFWDAKPGERWSRCRESAGESEVPQGTTATASVSKTRMVPPVEHFVGLQRFSVLRPLASRAPRRFWHGREDPFDHSCAGGVRTRVSGRLN